VNEADSEGRTPLHMAAAIGHLQIANALLGSGAQTEPRDSKQNTPLHYAAGYGRTEMCQILLEAGADGGAKNATGKTPFDLVKMSPQNPINSHEDTLYQLEAASKVQM
jgi:ankyrin repeat protein